MGLLSIFSKRKGFNFKPVLNGWIPEDKEDPKRWTFGAMARKKELPFKLIYGLQTTHIIEERTPISDQFDIGSCVLNATCDGYEIRQGFEGPVWQISRMFGYDITRMRMGTLSEDSGCHIWMALDQMRKVGQVPEYKFPYSKSLMTKRPPLELFTLASQNKLTAYAKLEATGKTLADQIESCIRNDCPVPYGTEVSQEFIDYRGENKVFGVMKAPDARHAMLLVGVRFVGGARQFLVRNSWSRMWGLDGRVWVSEAHVVSSRSADHHVLLHGKNLKA